MPASESYDYIIVGAGSAGCVLANRLGEDRSLRILVLEAGGSEQAVIVDMPAALSIPMNTKRFNWGMKTEPEPALGGRDVNLPRGKGRGGSSSINGMCWVRGNPMDYEMWEACGAEGWRWSNVLPYFQRLENVEGGGFAELRDPGIARGHDQPVAFGVLQHGPGQRMFAPAAAQDQDVHCRPRWTIACKPHRVCGRGRQDWPCSKTTTRPRRRATARNSPSRNCPAR